MNGVVVDTSVWVDFLAGVSIPELEEALARGVVVLAPVVVIFFLAQRYFVEGIATTGVKG